jgi:hypothetical protein
MSQFTAITPQQFANKAWQRYTGYAFAAKANAIPVVAAELANLVPALPLGFVQANDGSFQLVAITSLQPGTNLFVAPKGDWIGQYIPAVLRCYPFLLRKAPDKDESIFCIDENSGLAVEPGKGEAFFDEAGRPAQALNDMLAFVSQVETSRVVTQAAVDALQAADLIQNWPLQMQNGGRTIAVEGLYRINEAMLNAVPSHVLLSLRAAGCLPLAYAQLLSMNQLAMLQTASDLQERLRGNIAQQPQKLDGLAGFALSDSGTLKFS